MLGLLHLLDQAMLPMPQQSSSFWKKITITVNSYKWGKAVVQLQWAMKLRHPQSRHLRSANQENLLDGCLESKVPAPA